MIQGRAGLANGRWPPQASTEGGNGATAFPGVSLEVWLHWPPDFRGIEGVGPQSQDARGKSGDLGESALRERTLAAPGYGHRGTTRLLALTLKVAAFPGISAANPALERLAALQNGWESVRPPRHAAVGRCLRAVPAEGPVQAHGQG